MSSIHVGIPVLTFELEESMKDPKQFNSALNFALVLVGIAFSVIGIAGASCFTDAQPIIISNLPSTSSYAVLVKLAVAATLLFTIPLTLSPALNLLEKLIFAKFNKYNNKNNENNKIINESTSLLMNGKPYNEEQYEVTALNNKSNKTHKPYNTNGNITNNSNTISSLDELMSDNSSTLNVINSNNVSIPLSNRIARGILRICIFFFVTLLAASVPCFTLIMSLIGCFTLSVLCFILPPIFYIRLVQMNNSDNKISWLKLDVVGCSLFVLFGLFTMILGSSVVLKGKCG